MPEDELMERTRALAAEFAERGDVLGWFDELYKRAGGDHEQIKWADLEPNKYLRSWAEDTGLKGDGRNALVVGCGLGDDARYLYDLGFTVTAFDISATAIDWAKKLHHDTSINFVTADLFHPPGEWLRAFDLVLEIYTIQPLPLEIRSDVIDAVAAFVGNDGELVVVTRGREDDAIPEKLPWPVSRRELSRFEASGLEQTNFRIFPADDEGDPDRWVIQMKKVK